EDGRVRGDAERQRQDRDERGPARLQHHASGVADVLNQPAQHDHCLQAAELKTGNCNYPARSATIGSTREARRAGNSVAARPTASSSVMIAAYVTGSVVVTPYNCVLITFADGSAAITPIATP